MRQERRERGRESGKSSGSRSRENYMYITYMECRHIMSLHTTAQCTHSHTLHTCVFYCTVHHCAYDGTEYTQAESEM